MPRTYVGQDEEEIADAYAALLKVQHFEELVQFISTNPIVRTAAFTAMLRQIYLEEAAHDDSHAGKMFVDLYRCFFMLLHEFFYRERCTSSVDRAVESLAPRKSIEIPRFYDCVMTLLEGRPVPNLNPPADPEREADRIQRELEVVIGRRAELPPYEPTPGVKWNLIALQCPRCCLQYSAIRAHAIDLVAAPELVPPLKEGGINVPGCPQCSEVCAWPIGVFVEDQPCAGDLLASLSCAIRASDDYIIYQPPPGTIQLPDLNRVLEIRLSFRVRDLKWQLPQVASMRIAYGLEGFGDLGTDSASSTAFPRAMAVHISDITAKIRSGTLPLYQAERQIFEYVPNFGANWPLIMAPHTVADGGNKLEALVQSMIAEAVAEAKRADGPTRALLALGTAVKYLECNERAAAERTFARADDILQETPRTHPKWDTTAVAIRVHRADMLASFGHYDAAEELRTEGDKWLAGDSYRARVMRAGRNAQIALSISESASLGEALDQFPPCIEELRRLVAEKETGNTPEHRDWGVHAVDSLSGALANYAGVLSNIADHIEVATLANSDTLPSDMSRVPLAIDPDAAVSLIGNLRPRLRRIFPAGFFAEAVRFEAIRLLQQALEISVSIQSWGFAAIQANRLTTLFDHLRQTERAIEYADLTMQYAALVRDRVRESTAHVFLARDALERSQGAEALAHLKSGALLSIREGIASGHRTNEQPITTYLGPAVMKTIDLGADQIEAVALVENMKAAMMAPSLLVGFPIGTSDAGDSELSGAVERAHHERELVRLKAMWQPDDAAVQCEIVALDERLSDLRQQLSLRDRQFAAWIDSSTTDLASPKALSRQLASLGEETRLLGILMSPGRVWSYLIEQDKAWSHETVVEQSSLAGSWGQEVLARKAEIFLTPFLQELRRMRPTDRLLISPDAGFFDLPFAAMLLDGEPLCSRVTLSIVQGAGVLEAVRNRGRKCYSNFVGIGGPQRMDQCDLPGARLEVQRICEIFKSSVTPLTGRRATVGAMVEAARTADVLHIACHADIMQGRSRLLLTPDVKGSDSGVFSEDRVLYELNVPTGCLVNLAGCTTAVQTQAKGPLLGGLVPAFQVKGGGSVLASVRPIADGEATVFQEEFYERLVAGIGPARALAEAQRRCISGHLGSEMTDVQAWAPYVLYGAS